MEKKELAPGIEQISENVFRLTKEPLYKFKQGHMLYCDLQFDYDVSDFLKEDLAEFKGVDKKLLEPITSLKEAIERKKAIKQYKRILDEGDFYTYYLTELLDVIDTYKFAKSKMGRQAIAMYQWSEMARRYTKGKYPFEFIIIGRNLLNNETIMDFRVVGAVSSIEEENIVKDVIESLNPPYPVTYEIYIGEKFDVDSKKRTITAVE